MPRIKAYKGARGHIIPIDEAKVATAYRCPWTGRVFGSKTGYTNHLRVLRRDNIHAAIRQDIAKRLHEDLCNQPTFDDIVAWVETHPEFFFDAASWQRGEGRQDRIAHYRDKFWIKITYLDLQWTPNASNSHAHPRGGVTNWGGRAVDRDGKPLPRGYPGWTGRIEYRMSHDLGFGSDVMRGIGIHTGSGGGVKDLRYGYSVTFFDSDWPGIADRALFDRLAENGKSLAYRYGTPDYFR